MAGGMGGSWFGPTVGLVATGDLSSNQYYVMKFGSTAKTVKVAAAVTDALAGILQNEPASGEAAQVAGLGYCLAAAEASVTQGSYLAVSSTGRVKSTTTNLDYIIGTAQEASVSAGDVIQICVNIQTHSDS